MAGRGAIGALGVLLVASTLGAGGSAGAAVLATAEGPVRVASSPVRVTLDRVQGGEPVAVVVSGVEGGRSGVLNLFLAGPQPTDRSRGAADPDYIGSFSLFNAGPDSRIAVTVPPGLRPALGRDRPVIEIVPVGTTPAAVTFGAISLHSQ